MLTENEYKTENMKHIYYRLYCLILKHIFGPKTEMTENRKSVIFWYRKQRQISVGL